MQGDSRIIHTGVTRLSYADSMLHSICNNIDQAINDAKRMNVSAKFKKCVAKSERVVAKMREASIGLVKINKTLQILEYKVLDMEE